MRDPELEPTEPPAVPKADPDTVKAVSRLEEAVEALDRHLKDSAEMYQYLNGLIHKNREYLAALRQKIDEVEGVAQKALDKTLVLLPEPNHCRKCGKKVGQRDKVCGGCGRNPQL